MKFGLGITFFVLAGLLLSGCEGQEWNNPYPYEDPKSRTLYSAFSERPKHLDPAKSYSYSETVILSQIYEPPLQYHYLKRPYVLEPLTAVQLPELRYLSADGKELPESANGKALPISLNDKELSEKNANSKELPQNTNTNANANANTKELSQNANQNQVAYSEYIISIKPGIFFQTHPAFAKDAKGQFRYLNLSEEQARQYHTLGDFKETDTRELTAEDFVYQIKRLAEPSLNSPIYGLMSQYIEGLTELRQELMLARKQEEASAKAQSAEFLGLERDLRPYTLLGVNAISKYQYRIRIKGKYPQFPYWLAMNFFAPIPWEVALFYAQPSLQKHNISLDWYPVGTGPFRLAENNPDRRMTLLKNPQYREEFFPNEGVEKDNATGILQDAGKKLPLIDKVIFSLEKESIPFWNKFLQGYYDVSPIASDNFSSAIRLNSAGNLVVTEELEKKGMRLTTSVSPNVFYWGFNMLDKTVGGNSLEAKKLRQAIALAFDVEEFISIFLNGRGVLAHGPIPPDIFGYETQLPASGVTSSSTFASAVSKVKINSEEKSNSEKLNSDEKLNSEAIKNGSNHKASRAKAIEKAKKLLKEAGIPKNLTIALDTVASGDPDEIAMHAWLKEQLEKIGLQLLIRGTQYNRFQDKIVQGDVQMFFLGWTADYPDPENFLFLFYGPNAAVKFGGENKTNYANPEYDHLFEKMRLLPEGSERLAVIADMIKILKEDTPWIWGFYPKSFVLYQGWTRVTKPSTMINNNLKYFNVYPEQREKSQHAWNQPLLWPLGILVLMLILIALFAILRYRWTETKTWRRK